MPLKLQPRVPQRIHGFVVSRAGELSSLMPMGLDTRLSTVMTRRAGWGWGVGVGVATAGGGSLAEVIVAPSRGWPASSNAHGSEIRDPQSSRSMCRCAPVLEPDEPTVPNWA